MNWKARGRRQIVILLGVVIVAGVAAGSAFGYKVATGSQTAAIHAAVRAYLPKCTTSRVRVTFRATDVSTANGRYAQSGVDDTGYDCFAFAFFLRRPNLLSNHWTVIGEYPDSVMSCSSFRKFLPESVIRDFRVEGLSGPMSNPTTGAC